MLLLEIQRYIYNHINIDMHKINLLLLACSICYKKDKDFIKDYNNENNYNISEKIINLINSLNDEILTNEFNFINTIEINNNILYNIFNMLSENLINYDNIIYDLYKDYHDVGMGIIFIPNDIINIMIKELNIKENDNILNIYSVSGNELKECYKYNKNKNNLYGLSNNKFKYLLSKINLILNDIDNNNNLKYNNYVYEEYNINEFDKILLFPPYGVNSKTQKLYNCLNEQNYILYSIDLLKKGGICSCIVPKSNFNDGIGKNKFKRMLLKKCKILKIYNCNDKIFLPFACVECAIIIFQKIYDTLDNIEEAKENNNKINNDKVEIIDYSDDGYITKRLLRIYDHNPIIKTQLKNLKYNNNWNYEE